MVIEKVNKSKYFPKLGESIDISNLQFCNDFQGIMMDIISGKNLFVVSYILYVHDQYLKLNGLEFKKYVGV